MTKQCSFVGTTNKRCPGTAENGDLCHWHDPNETKDRPRDRRDLETWAKSGKPMEGFSLRNAELENIDLVNKDGDEGFNLTNADLNHANLRGAHLYNIDLSGSALLKADFRHANLNFADMRDTDILGTDMTKARIEHTKWGTKVRQEVLAEDALRQGQHEKALDYYQQAEETYRSLYKCCEAAGQFEEAGQFYYREMVTNRHQLPLISSKRFLSKMVDLMCAYGESPARVIGISIALILFCSVFYFFLGIDNEGLAVVYRPDKDLTENILALGNCIYFSVVTFTTLGYGDIAPIGWARLVATIEAFSGTFILALFVVVFAKKMMR
jgi:hypothetical protein